MRSDATKNEFDCVQWTRETRDRLTAKFEGMSSEERDQWYETWRPAHPFLAELWDRRVTPTGKRYPPRAVNQ